METKTSNSHDILHLPEIVKLCEVTKYRTY
ncbi:hypothetical protein BLAT2472_30647 [Burkholderia latens]